MAVDKKQLSSTSDVTASLGAAAKVISTVTAFRHGAVEVVDILCTDTNHYYIKTSQGQVEIGGTPEWGSGKQIGGR